MQAVLAVHATNLQHFASARKAYLAMVEESVAFVKGAGVGGAAKVLARGGLGFFDWLL